ncbi:MULTISPECIES: SIR2 family anti-phage-associated protein [unclassified Pseudomonas]|uniref:SIR2 family anti-phage-associated protein n=1 Tax=unclassified Pseudomonas TaxID=196821 RepID=UPI00244A9FC8|nr:MULTISPECIES: SIR2 family anti-phage-associated protein [unclassified Pseudomonas]MDH0303332.1 SIR2 family protein [Pseudomonas sp. GD04091]MDH1985356.1 SIR2 family protein [Pseudomonas sp. GD03689]
MPFAAIRGGTALTDETELEAYLASLLRLENIGLLLGAGASVAAGGLTMIALWTRFVTESPEDANWMVEHGFLRQDAITLPRPVTPNFEHLIDSLEIALSDWTRQMGMFDSNPIDYAAGEQELEENLGNLKKVKAALFRTVVNAALLRQEWWLSPSGVESDDDSLASQRTILQKLVSARQPGQSSPWVFTTNYDLAIEWAAESIDLQVSNGFLGTHTRRFSPQSFDLGFRNTQARGEARFGVYNIYLAKLHGSLTWKQERGQVFEVAAPLAHQRIEAFMAERDGEDLGLMVMPRAAKYMDTIGYVLGELFRRFAEFMSKPQSCLILCGYGFGDEHINRLIRSALLNPTLQLVIYSSGFNGDPVDQSLPQALRKLLSLKNPRVTVVGGGAAHAYVDSLARHLPDPLIYDEDMRKFERALREPQDLQGRAAAPENVQ